MPSLVRRLLPFSFAFALAALTAAPVQADVVFGSSRTWEHSARVERGQTIWIHGVNGGIRAEATTGDQVIVEATIKGRTSDPRDVDIRVVPDSDGIAFCAIYPGSRSVCESGRYEMPVKNNDVQVSFVVRVPAGVKLQASTVNGGIIVRGLDAPVRAVTVNGSCEIATTSSGEARTVNGSVRASLGRIAVTDALEFSTVNGSVTLHVEGPLDAEISARTVNGRVRSEFDVANSRRRGGRTLEGTIGRGGARIDMSCVNGSISLKRGTEL